MSIHQLHRQRPLISATGSLPAQSLLVHAEVTRHFCQDLRQRFGFEMPDQGLLPLRAPFVDPSLYPLDKVLFSQHHLTLDAFPRCRVSSSHPLDDKLSVLLAAFSDLPKHAVVTHPGLFLFRVHITWKTTPPVFLQRADFLFDRFPLVRPNSYRIQMNVSAKLQ